MPARLAFVVSLDCLIFSDQVELTRGSERGKVHVATDIVVAKLAS